MMAGFSQIQNCFWDDEYTESLDREQKFLYMLLLSYPTSNMAGIFKVTEKKLAYYMESEKSIIHANLQKLQDDGKIAFDGEVIWIKNFHKYHKWQANSKHVQSVREFVRTELPADSVVKKEFEQFFSGILFDNQSNINQMENRSLPIENDMDIDTEPIGYPMPIECLSDAYRMGTDICNIKDNILNISDDRLKTNFSIQKELKNKKVTVNVADSQAKSASGREIVPKDQNSNQEKSKEKPKMSPDDDAYWDPFKGEAERARAFYRETKIIPVKSSWGLWKNSLAELSEADISIDLMVQAIREMRKDGLRVSSPKSVFKVAQDMKSRNLVKPQQPEKKESFSEVAKRIQAERDSGQRSTFMDVFFGNRQKTEEQKMEVIDV